MDDSRCSTDSPKKNNGSTDNEKDSRQLQTIDVAELEKIVDCNSQDILGYPAKNLVDMSGSWRTDSWIDKATITIKTKDEVYVQGFKVTSDGAAFVEVYVSRMHEPDEPNAKRKYRLLLSRSSLMTPLQSSPNKFNTFRLKERTFDHDLLHESTRKQKWDLFKFVCTQTFNKDVSYGLHKVHIMTRDETSVENIQASDTNLDLGMFRLRQRDSATRDSLKVGSFFAKRRRYGSESPDRNDYDQDRQCKVTKSKRQASDSDNLSLTDTTTSYPTSSISNTRDETIGCSQVSSYQSRDEYIPYNDGSNRASSARIDLSRRFSQDNSNTEKDTHESIVCTLHPINYDTTTDNSRTVDTSNDVPTGSNDATIIMRKKVYPKILPYDKILDGVVFVLSGYINPLRGQLRDMAINMGAKYEKDWNARCTHLICAFKNTPKYKQVMSCNGRILREHWVAECSREKKLTDWRKYKLGDYPYPDSEEEDK